MKKQKFEIAECPYCHMDSLFRAIGGKKQCMRCGKTVCEEKKQDVAFLDVT